jgi:hypothetical protein
MPSHASSWGYDARQRQRPKDTDIASPVLSALRHQPGGRNSLKQAIDIMISQGLPVRMTVHDTSNVRIDP